MTHCLNLQGKLVRTVSWRGKGETVVLTALLLLSTEYQVTLSLTPVQINSYPPCDSIAWEFIKRRIACAFNLDMYQYFDRFFCLRLYDLLRDSLKSHIFIPNFIFFLISGKWFRFVLFNLCLRRCANSRMVPGSISGGVTGIFSDILPSDCTIALGSTHPLVKMSTRNIPGGKGVLCVRLKTSLPSRVECQ
jgi:hypothetical protein